MLERLQKSSAKTIKIEINIKWADERNKGQVKIWKSGQKAYFQNN